MADTSGIRPIETRYAGCRFRSRLEARWAVFFNKLGIAWEYEPQGYEIEGRPYLPDFWLPKLRLWVEVKGAEEYIDVELMVAASIPHWGLPNSPKLADQVEHDARLLILGPLGQVHGVTFDNDPSLRLISQPAHTVLAFHEGQVLQWSAMFDGTGQIHFQMGDSEVGNDGGWSSTQINWDTRYVEWGNWVGGGFALIEAPLSDSIKRVASAYTAARSARFEHGENG